MSWRSMRSLGLLAAAVILVGAAAVVGQQYAQRHLLASVLGPGSQAESIEIVWSKSAACAQDIQLLLPSAKDDSNNALRLRADRMWLAFDRAALLKKRFVFPRVIIEDAVISAANPAGPAAQAVVDVPFDAVANDAVDNDAVDNDAVDNDAVDNDAGTDLDFRAGPVVEFDAAVAKQTAAAAAMQNDAQEHHPGTGHAALITPSGNKLMWLEQLNQCRNSVAAERFVAGRQVAIDADMLTEKLQSQFENIRQQSMRMLNEARDLQVSLVGLDNILRHEAQVNRSYARLEQITQELKQQRSGLQVLDKRLSDLQANLRAQTLDETEELQKLATEFRSPDAHELAKLLLEHCVRDALHSPGRYASVLADFIRKPYAYQAGQRGRTIRQPLELQPEFASQSTKIKGTLAIDGTSRRFEAQGRFLLASASSAGSQAQSAASFLPAPADRTDLWQMTIDYPKHQLQLQGYSLSGDGSTAIHFSSSRDDQLGFDARLIDGRVISAAGHFQLPHWIGTEEAQRSIYGFCEIYNNARVLTQCLAKAFSSADDAPEQLGFVMAEASEQTASQPEIQVDGQVIQWLQAQIEQAAVQQMAVVYDQAVANLDQLMKEKISQQRSLLATLRRDAEQHLDDQFDELRRIRAAIDSLIEQRVGGYMAQQRHRGHLDR